MITAVDTNVLLDVFTSSDEHGPLSADWLDEAYNAGAVIVCDIVYAELVPSARSRDALERALQEMGATLSSIDPSIAYEAGIRWTRYRRSGGPRERIVADFLIGAHALFAADVFLTRDRGFYSTYFPELKGPDVL